MVEIGTHLELVEMKYFVWSKTIFPLQNFKIASELEKSIICPPVRYSASSIWMVQLSTALQAFPHTPCPLWGNLCLWGMHTHSPLLFPLHYISATLVLSCVGYAQCGAGHIHRMPVIWRTEFRPSSDHEGSPWTGPSFIPSPLPVLGRFLSLRAINPITYWKSCFYAPHIENSTPGCGTLLYSFSHEHLPAATSAWNALPNPINQITSLTSVKPLLKIHSCCEGWTD